MPPFAKSTAPISGTDWLSQMRGYGSPTNSWARPQLTHEQINMGNTAAAVPFEAQPEGWGGAFGKDGWGGLALGAAQGVGNLFMGMQQYGLAKKTLAENQRQFNMNWDAQRSTTNASLSDRQAARVASNPGAYQSVSDYMGQYGIK
jgi:hypothetical protein